LFPADKNAMKIQKILHNKYPELLQSDIQEIIDPDVNNKGQISIVKIKPEIRQKFGG
jgi:hypothetical protein